MRTVVMTTYNGEKFIKAQIDSIIGQLAEDDEFIISDDGSSDGTIAIINQYVSNDSRIKLIRGPQKGVIKNIEYVLRFCTGDIVFIADQDDIWELTKIDTIDRVFALNTDIKLIMHNGVEIGNNSVLKEQYRMKHGVFRNLIKSCYYGHRMAFRKELIEEILPFPPNCVSYDQYIGIICEVEKCGMFIEDKLTKHLIHGENWSQPLGLFSKIRFRMSMWKHLNFYLSNRKNSIEK